MREEPCLSSRNRIVAQERDSVSAYKARERQQELGPSNRAGIVAEGHDCLLKMKDTCPEKLVSNERKKCINRMSRA